MITTTGLLAAARILSKPINDLYELGKEKFKTELSKAKTISNINKMHKSISSVHKVKTIWQIDKAVSLKSFYYPSSLIIDDKKTNINSIKKIQHTENILIQGMVGQGKSIFLRYLSYQEIQIGTKIPIFFELRKIEKQETLKTNILKILDSYGFGSSAEMFDFLCSSGKIIFLLDGFDEIISDKVSSTITEIELLSEKYPELKIIISSRPDSGIEKSTYFRVLKLAPLDEADISPLLAKIMENKDQAIEINNAIINSGTNIKSLLTTPLMATLLVLVYKSEQKIPEQLSEFYENLFALLLYRHDKSKPGYVRERSTNLNERKLQQVFEAFCFSTRKRGLSTISSEDMHSAAEDAFKSTQTPCDSSDFIKDITKVSNLIIEEGHQYHFIHKSVQEFHAANYIKGRPEEAAIKFYGAMIQNHHNWRQEIDFLSQIDSYRHAKYLLIPSILLFFKTHEISTEQWQPLSETQTNSILSMFNFILPPDYETSETSEIYYSFGDEHMLYGIHKPLLNIFNKILNIDGKGFFSKNTRRTDQLISILKEQKPDHQKTHENQYSFLQYYKSMKLLGKCNEAIQLPIKKLHELLLTKLNSTVHEEASLNI